MDRFLDNQAARRTYHEIISQLDTMPPDVERAETSTSCNSPIAGMNTAAACLELASSCLQYTLHKNPKNDPETASILQDAKNACLHASEYCSRYNMQKEKGWALAFLYLIAQRGDNEAGTEIAWNNLTAHVNTWRLSQPTAPPPDKIVTQVVVFVGCNNPSTFWSM
jgi:hypothetical protein